MTLVLDTQTGTYAPQQCPGMWTNDKEKAKQFSRADAEKFIARMWQGRKQTTRFRIVPL